MSAVLKKGAPSRSYPSRQRKLGPAPFASFEDLSDELDSPGGTEETNKVDVMPEIKEDRMNERQGAGGYQSPTQQNQVYGAAEDETPVAVRAHKNVTATSSTSTVTFAASQSAPTSGPTSGLQTPSTPRIDISCASSSTPPSDESEKELFQGGLGFAFHEEAVEELRSSTEELDLEEEEISSEEERRRRRIEEQELREQEIYRRSSHPANIFTRKSSCPAAPPPPVEDQQRKPSAHSLFLEGLLNRPCRHASFGHGDYMRSGAVSSLSTYSAGSGMRSRSRSPSPHKMLFETSFCGNKPIPTKSMEAESPPKDKDIGVSVAGPSTFSPKPFTHGGSFHSYSTPQSTHVSAAATPTTSARFGMSEDNRSLKSPKKMVITPSWEKQSELEQVCSQVAGPKDIDSVSRSKTPLSPQPSSLGFDSRRPSTGRRSVSPHKMLLETSFCGNKPIPTRSMEAESPPKDLPDLTSLLAECNRLAPVSASSSSSSQVNTHCHKTVITAQVHRHSTPGDRSSTINKDEDPAKVPLQRKSDAGQYALGGSEWNVPASPESPKSSDLWQPLSPRMELRSPVSSTTTTTNQSRSQPPPPKSDRTNDFDDSFTTSSTAPTPQGQKGQEEKPSTSSSRHTENFQNATASSNSTSSAAMTKKYNQDQVNDPGSSSTKEIARTSSIKTGIGGGSSGGGGKSVGFQSEKSESSRDHEDEDAEITTEMKISEDPTVTVEDVPIESKGLFFQTDSFDEEGDLPYVPTTLPQEKSTGVAIIPVSERKKMALMLTTPVQRPKVNRPAAPASLNDYIEYSKNTLPKSGKGAGSSGDSAGTVDSGDGQQIAKMKINLPRDDSITSQGGGKSHRKSLPTTTWTDFAHMGLRSPREIRRKMKAEENGAVDDISSYHSDSSSTNDIPGVVDGAAEEESESLLKLPKVPFAMDLDVHSNRSSVISQDEVQKSPSECSALLGSPDEPDLSSKKSDSHD